MSATRAVAAALLGLAAFALAGCGSDEPSTPAPPASQPFLLVAFMSNRPPSATSGHDIYFYEAGGDQPAWLPPGLNTIYDEGLMSLSADGRLLAFTSSRTLTGINTTMFLYDVAAAETHPLYSPATYFGVENPALSGDARLLAFHYRIPDGIFGLTIGLVDVAADTTRTLPSLHSFGADEFDPALTGDGALVAFTSNRAGTFDVYLYSVPGDSLVPLPGLNSDYSETGVTISGDGRWLAFHSNRPGGRGAFDVYVYDRQSGNVETLPGGNSPLAEINPAISPDGRWVAYTSENDGAGDIRVYDRQQGRLVTLPGMNDPYFFDRFPTVALVTGTSVRAVPNPRSGR